MICDKCGFEHNSKSVCPKCGARVVYVNEDYLRRRKEWEEAQKNPESAGKDSILPGIMHSTREDYDRRHGNDKVTELNDKFQDDGKKDRSKGKGRSEMTGLSFAAIKEKIQKGILNAAEKLAAFIRKHKKRREADNPVIRELKFDDSPETFDNSPAVTEHKVFHGVRNPALLAVLSAAGIIVAAVAAFNIVKAVKNRDRSRIFIYDGTNGYFAGSEDSPVITEGGRNMVFEQADDGCFIARDSSHIIIFRNGRICSVDADNAEIVAYNGELDTIVYTENGNTMVTDGKDTGELKFNDGIPAGGYTEDCAVSDNGKYIFLTTCGQSEDFSAGEYGVYFGTAEYGMNTVRESSESARVVNISDDGTVIYEDMDNAAYGVINGRRLMKLDEGGISTLSENITAVQYDDVNRKVYYIDDSGNLYAACPDDLTSAFFCVAENADDLKKPSSGDYTGGMVYRHGTDYYYTEGLQNENGEGISMYLFTGSSETLIYLYNADDFYCYDGKNLYYKDRKDPEAEIAVTDVDYVSFMPDGSYVYLSDEKLYFYNSESGKKVLISENVDGINDIEVCGKKIYYIDGSNTLYSAGIKGGKKQNYGQVEFITRTR